MAPNARKAPRPGSRLEDWLAVCEAAPASKSAGEVDALSDGMKRWPTWVDLAGATADDADAERASRAIERSTARLWRRQRAEHRAGNARLADALHTLASMLRSS